jgi:hypothetical protein
MVGEEGGTVLCDGNGGFKPVLRNEWERPASVNACILKHEESHIQFHKDRAPDSCKDKPAGEYARIPADLSSENEYIAHSVSLACFEAALGAISPDAGYSLEREWLKHERDQAVRLVEEYKLKYQNETDILKPMPQWQPMQP